MWDVLPGSCLHHMNDFCARAACESAPCELGAAKTFCLSSQRAASRGLHGRQGKAVRQAGDHEISLQRSGSLGR